MLPFARAAADAGHDVLIAAQHSRTAEIERAGLAAAPVAEADRSAWAPVQAALRTQPLGEANRRMLADGFAGLMLDASLPDTLALVEERSPDLVVRETFEFAGALAAERFGIPAARVALGLQRTEAWAIAGAAPGLAAARERIGLAPDPRGDALRRVPALTATPAALEAPFTGRRARPPLPRRGGRCDAGRPVARRPAAARLPHARLGRAAQLGYPGSHRDASPRSPRSRSGPPRHGRPRDGRGRAGPLPENVRVEGWVPQDAVLAHAAAVVCHGGYGDGRSRRARARRAARAAPPLLEPPVAQRRARRRARRPGSR